LISVSEKPGTVHSGDFKESALGHYYEYLLTQSLQKAGVPSVKFSEFFEYCSHLAWHFHLSKKSELSELELRRFNEEFSKDWHTVDFGARLDKLTLAKILVGRGGFFSFRYPYIYYFLIGRYLSLNLSKPDIRDYVSRCCKHLYVREYANSVLFLAHHTNDEFVLSSILDSLRMRFNKSSPIMFAGDSAMINAVINDAPKLQYRGGSPEQHRESMNKAKDKLDDGKDGLAEGEEAGEDLSLAAELTTLFKTVEILGQVLKNQYARIERAKRVAIFDELFLGPLRALSSFYEFIARNPEHLVAGIENVLKDRHKLTDPEKRARVARRIVASIIQAISFGFLYKTAASVSSDDLREDIHAAVQKRNTVAFKVIELGVLLDSPARIPKSLIKTLKQEAQSDGIALRLINMFAIQHLYMFRTDEKDKQWLAKELEFGMEVQRSVEFRRPKTQRLKGTH